MNNPRYVILAVLTALAVAAPACSQEAGDKVLDATRKGAATAVDETQKASEKTADATKKVAEQTVDKTKELAGDIADKTKDASVTTGEAITDTWITATLKAKFADETRLEGSHISVDTDGHVVTLNGTVATASAKDRAVMIARGTEGVTRVVNRLAVK